MKKLTTTMAVMALVLMVTTASAVAKNKVSLEGKEFMAYKAKLTGSTALVFISPELKVLFGGCKMKKGVIACSKIVDRS